MKKTVFDKNEMIVSPNLQKSKKAVAPASVTKHCKVRRLSAMTYDCLA